MQSSNVDVNSNINSGVNTAFFVKKRGFFSRILPVLVMLSFVWLELYPTLTGANSISINLGSFGSLPVYLAINVIFYGLLSYLIFEFLFYVYRFCIGFSIYSFMIPKDVLIDKFRTWYLIRNIILGLIFNLRFFFPYINTYLCIFELLFNFLFILGLYFDLSKNYVEPLVGQFVFKTLSVPVIIYEVYEVIVLMAGVLWEKNLNLF